MDKNKIKETLIDFGKKTLKFTVVTAAIAAVSFVSIKFYQETDKKNFSIQASLVPTHYSECASFLGYEFTDELVEAIQEKDIDLYGVYIGSYPYSDAKGAAFLEDGKDAVPGTAERLKIVSSEYVTYTEEYIEKYYAPGHRPASDGYWSYTIDIVK